MTTAITNEWSVPGKLDAVAASGLKNVYVSIDAATIAEHENNRGLKGLGERIVSCRALASLYNSEGR